MSRPRAVVYISVDSEICGNCHIILELIIVSVVWFMWTGAKNI